MSIRQSKPVPPSIIEASAPMTRIKLAIGGTVYELPIGSRDEFATAVQALCPQYIVGSEVEAAMEWYRQHEATDKPWYATASGGAPSNPAPTGASNPDFGLTVGQVILRRRYGTPDEYTSRVLSNFGEIGRAEAEQAIAKYKIRWAAAGRANQPTIPSYPPTVALQSHKLLEAGWPALTSASANFLSNAETRQANKLIDLLCGTFRRTPRETHHLTARLQQIFELGRLRRRLTTVEDHLYLTRIQGNLDQSVLRPIHDTTDYAQTQNQD